MKKHLNECKYSMISCPNNENCGLIMRLKLNDHLKTYCEYRLEHCILKCGQKLPLNEMDRHVVKECPKALIKCRNGCKD